MSWIKDGNTIVANYLGEQVTGVVQDSRVKYGGRVQYGVRLTRPVNFRWRTEPVVYVLVDDTNIVQDLGTEIYTPYATANS